MTREEKIKVLTMRLDGCTYTEIAEQMGVTRQRIEQIVKSLSGGRGADGKNVVYPKLAAWMKENKISVKKLADLVGLKSKNSYSVTARLRGQTDFRISEIQKIVEISGMPYEIIFKKKEKNDESKSIDE